MKLEQIRKMVQRQYAAEAVGEHIAYLPGDARVVSGSPRIDSHLHFLETQYGLRLSLSPDYSEIAGHSVIDKTKFLMFVLKWS